MSELTGMFNKEPMEMTHILPIFAAASSGLIEESPASTLDNAPII